MNRSFGSSHGRSVRFVSEGHDVFVLVVFPSHELLHSLLVIKDRVISGFV
jgi:hypothetical protein